MLRRVLLPVRSLLKSQLETSPFVRRICEEHILAIVVLLIVNIHNIIYG